MSDDQDFFFDEEDEKSARDKTPAKAPGKSPAKAPARSTARSGAKTPAKSGTGTPAKASATSARNAAAVPPATVAGGAFFGQSVSMAVAGLAVVCALLVGLIAGVLIEQARSGGSSGVPAATTAAPSTGVAPPLTSNQLNSSKMPPGHPSIGATGSPSGTTKPSKIATGK